MCPASHWLAVVVDNSSHHHCYLVAMFPTEASTLHPLLPCHAWLQVGSQVPCLPILIYKWFNWLISQLVTSGPLDMADWTLIIFSYFTEMSCYWNVLLPKCPLPKCPLPKCPLPKCHGSNYYTSSWRPSWESVQYLGTCFTWINKCSVRWRSFLVTVISDLIIKVTLG